MRSALLRATRCLSWGDQGAGFTEWRTSVLDTNMAILIGVGREGRSEGQAAERDYHTKTQAAGGLPRVGRSLGQEA